MFFMSRRSALACVMLAGTASWGLAGCSSSSSPEKAATHFFELVNKNKIDEAVQMFSTRDVKAEEMTMAKGKFTTIVGRMYAVLQANDGLKGVQVDSVDPVSEDRARVNVTLTFKNGKTKTERLNMVRDNGNWMLSIK